jgi:hypothetical protein
MSMIPGASKNDVSEKLKRTRVILPEIGIPHSIRERPGLPGQEMSHSLNPLEFWRLLARLLLFLILAQEQYNGHQHRTNTGRIDAP